MTISRYLTFYITLFIVLFIARAPLLYAASVGDDPTIKIRFIDAPKNPFDPLDAVAAPDYAMLKNWAASPVVQNYGRLVPRNVTDNVVQGTAPVDVFFIHPTSYLSGDGWTSPMNPYSAAEENSNWMMAYQASTFNSCCNIYAPRYRQASIFSYLTGSTSKRDEVLKFSYKDVEAAFEYYLRHYNQGRPFILASHSQGTHHATQLVKLKIDNTPLAKRMVVAYLLGATQVGVTTEFLDGLSEIEACKSATQLKCINHWDTVAIDGYVIPRDGDSLCTNPLSWRVDGKIVLTEGHLGALPVKHRFNEDSSYGNRPRYQKITSLDDVVSGVATAQCIDGVLRVNRQSADMFAGLKDNGSYHLLDYPLFYLDIRDNAKLRIEEFFQEETIP